MSETPPFVITISRQLGSGAALIGRQLASRLGLFYLDREILQRAAQQLQLSEEEVQSHDETVTPFWQAAVQSFAYGSLPVAYAPPPLHLCSDREVREAEWGIIAEAARRRSAVVVGRGGVYALRDHPRHLSVFLHARDDFRLARVVETYHLPAAEARAALEASDRARAQYHHALSGRAWGDACQYDLCLDTSTFGLTAATDIILQHVCTRFGVACVG
jgi:CMP/dCMP kinase